MRRYRFMFFIVAVFAFIAFCRLIDLQVVHNAEYLAQSQMHLTRTAAIKAPRGDILDRNGKPFVQNETVFAVQLYDTPGMDDATRNDLLYRLATVIEKDEVKLTDSFPVADDRFTLPTEDIAAWKDKNHLPENAMAADAIDAFAEKYGVTDVYTDEMRRTLVGMRYEMERTGFSADTPYTVADGISDLLMTRLKEQSLDYPGVVIETSPRRRFVEGNTAAHLLGRVGKLYKEEYEALQGKNYAMNDVIGKQGIEKYYEDDLRGVDGRGRVEQSVDGSDIRLTNDRKPKTGNNVVLTIDLELQKTAEQALVDALAGVRQKSSEEKGEGANAACGALAAIDVNTGEILALASCPTYDPATFNEDYNSLIADTRAPMFNRAIGGAYEPGSTFKMATAISALEEGVITPTDTITDEGKYKFYDDYQPTCWIWRSSGTTHGTINVSQALEGSCNYFFYDVGRRTTIDKMNYYAEQLGLGTTTGIELTAEENSGKLATPAAYEKDGETWMPGDTLQYAIGQARNLFTPLQLANYLATIVNGGTRYRAHLVKAVRSSETGDLVSEVQPQVLSQLNIAPQNRKAVMEGMRDVVELGTASAVFTDFGVKVGGKTGTAEVPGKSDTGLFVGFAPYDNPTIAICVVLEEGVHGSNAATAVRAVLETYFSNETAPDDVAPKNTLLR